MKQVLTAMMMLVVLIVLPAAGQEWSAEQQEVWKAVMWTWDVENDVDWCAEACHPNVLAWGVDYPAPRNREQISTWWKRNAESSTTLEKQVTPVGIVVQGDVAVAHYYYTTLSENKDGKRETEHGRYTDVLVKEDGKWMYIAWNGGEMDD